MRVSYPVHEAQNRPGQERVARVILKNDRPAGDAMRLFQQNARIVGVMQHIDKHDHIYAVAIEWKSDPIERLHRDFGIGADQDVDADNGQFGTKLHHQRRDRAIPATDVQNGSGCRRNSLRYSCCQNAGSPIEHQICMNIADECHLPADQHIVCRLPEMRKDSTKGKQILRERCSRLIPRFPIHRVFPIQVEPGILPLRRPFRVQFMFVTA